MTLQRIPKRQLDLGSAQYFEPLAEDPVGNQLRVREGWLKIRDTMIYRAEQLTVAFTVVSGANKVRWDLVTLDETGAVGVTAGAEVADTSPEFSGVADPDEYSYPVAYVKVDEAGTVVVEDADITDIRPKWNLDELAAYLNNYVIVNGEDYGTSISKLDEEETHAAAYTGKPAAGNVLPDYSGDGAPEYAFSDDDDLTLALAYVDIELDRLKDWLGKTNLAETDPDYSAYEPLQVITDGDPVNEAIGKLDNAIGVVAGVLPVGAVMWFAVNSPPTGWLECDGSSLDTTTYADLFAVIGYVFGGSGANFNIPDLRGEFIRGWDNGRGVDTGRVFGSAQTDLFKSHDHYYRIRGSAFSGDLPLDSAFLGSTTYDHYATTATGGTETRPRNVTLLPCIYAAYIGGGD